MESTMTLRGRVGTDLTTSRTKTGTLCVRFRLAVSQWRRTDNGNYEELGVRWYSIRAWGRLAEYVLPSIRKGDPVLIVGRPVAQGWIDGEGEVRTDLVFNALTVGHDLNWGTSTFYRKGGGVPQIVEKAHISMDTQASPKGSEYRTDYAGGQEENSAAQDTYSGVKARYTGDTFEAGQYPSHVAGTDAELKDMEPAHSIFDSNYAEASVIQERMESSAA